MNPLAAFLLGMLFTDSAPFGDNGFGRPPTGPRRRRRPGQGGPVAPLPTTTTPTPTVQTPTGPVTAVPAPSVITVPASFPVPQPAPAPPPPVVFVPAAPAPRPAATPAPVFVAPWPQVVPAGLPAFPGSGWVPDEPPPAAVVSRANSLLPALWRGGPGTFKTEQTAGRWITYRATQMGTKRGVVAFRLRDQPPQSAQALAPRVAPTVTPGQTVLTSAPSSAAPAPSAVALPTLRRGSKGDDVRTVQRALGFSGADVDGDFGPKTEAAVRAFQASEGLGVDGVVGKNTWAALLG